MGLNNVFSRFLYPLYYLTAIVVFFLAYNAFLVDNTIEQLKFSLEETARAYDVSDLDGLDLLLNRMMVDEVLPGKISMVNVANLEYARNAISGNKGYKVIDSIKISLGAVIKEKEKRRNKLLIILDAINRSIKTVIRSVIALLRRLTIKEIHAPVKVNTLPLEKARALEKSGKLSEALALYNDFLNKNPAYEKSGLVKLRIASICNRAGQNKRAVLLYREVIKTFVGKKESYIAQMLLHNLEQIGNLREKANRLLSSLVEPGSDNPKVKQDLLFQLGVINLGLYNMEDSKKYFRRAIAADPNGALATKSKFLSAWVSKEANRMDESRREFSKLIEDNPTSIIAFDSRYQIADAYHKEGRYKEAINIYIKLADEYKGDPIASLCIFQAAASYMYDLNDDEKAKELFSTLIKQYPNSPYAQYVSQDNPIGIFITYLVPRATRVVAYRVGGLLALSGYSGKLVKFKDVLKEKEYVRAINDWMKDELPDTIGNLYVDIKGAELNFKPGKASGKARFTIGKFTMYGESEGYLERGGDGSLNLNLTKMFLEKIPIPPVLVNRSVGQVSLILARHFPLYFSNVSMEDGKVVLEGYGAERMVKTLSKRTRRLVGEITYKDIIDAKERKEVYGIFARKFPENDFSAYSKSDDESMFLDFFTRVYMYMGFKIMETVKDSKLDYERSVRSLGRLAVKKGKFKITLKDSDVTTSLNKLISADFPWVIDEEFLIDIKGINLRFSEDGFIRFDGKVAFGKAGLFTKPSRGKELRLEGRASVQIDEDSKLPRVIFEQAHIEGKAVEIGKLNLVTLRCLNLLKDAHIPFELEEASISSGNITLKGTGARDLTARIFSDPNLFSIFKVREWDMSLAGIRSLKAGIAKFVIDEKPQLKDVVKDKRDKKIGSSKSDIDNAKTKIKGESAIPDKSDISGGLEDWMVEGTERPSGEWEKEMAGTKEFEKASRTIERMSQFKKPAKAVRKSKKAEKEKIDKEGSAEPAFIMPSGEGEKLYPSLTGKAMPELDEAQAKGVTVSILGKSQKLDPKAKENIEAAIRSLKAAEQAQKGDNKIGNLVVLLQLSLREASKASSEEKSKKDSANTIDLQPRR